MIIRNEQMAVFEENAEEDFVQRLTAHLREDYGDALVRLADSESTVSELSDETLDKLVHVSIQRARKYDLTYESSISSFSAVMFEAAPNFDKHNLSSLCLKDKNIDPNDRLDEILKIFTEAHWEKVKRNYDVTAWEPIDEEIEKKAEEPGAIKNADNPQDLIETNIGTDSFKIAKSSKSKKSSDVEETIFTPETTGESKELAKNDDVQSDKTIPNFKE